MKRMKEKIYVSLYILVIISTMIPQRENMNNVSKLNYIIPGINEIYDSNDTEKNTNKNNEYSIKFIEIIKKYCNL